MSFNTLVIIWTIIGLVVFVVLLKIAAPYGRHVRNGWGPLIDNRLGWIIMELPSLLIVGAFLVLGTAPKTIPLLLMGGLFCFHYFNRSLIFPFRLRTDGKKMPVSIMFSAIFFNLVNGSVIGYQLGMIGQYTNDWLTDPRYLIGLFVFMLGMAINWDSDTRLINLRKPGETGYKIPTGGFFRFVSCPNLGGEILEWWGFAIMTWSLGGLSFAIWTTANVLPRAMKHHQWYLEKFPEYPKERKAAIPFLV